MVLCPWSVVRSPNWQESRYGTKVLERVALRTWLVISFFLDYFVEYLSFVLSWLLFQVINGKVFSKACRSRNVKLSGKLFIPDIDMDPSDHWHCLQCVCSNEWEPNCPGNRSKKISIKLFLVIDRIDQWQSVRPTVPWSEWWKQIAGELLFLIIHLEVITGRVFSSNPCWYSVCLGR